MIDKYLDYIQDNVDYGVAQKHSQGPVSPAPLFRDVRPHLKDMCKTMNHITKKFVKGLETVFQPFDPMKSYRHKDHMLIPGSEFSQNYIKTFIRNIAVTVERFKSNWKIVDYNRLANRDQGFKGHYIIDYNINQDADFYVCYLIPGGVRLGKLFVSKNHHTSLGCLIIAEKGFGSRVKHEGVYEFLISVPY